MKVLFFPLMAAGGNSTGLVIQKSMEKQPHVAVDLQPYFWLILS